VADFFSPTTEYLDFRAAWSSLSEELKATAPMSEASFLKVNLFFLPLREGANRYFKSPLFVVFFIEKKNCHLTACL
jgi:hypothetical protein